MRNWQSFEPASAAAPMRLLSFAGPRGLGASPNLLLHLPQPGETPADALRRAAPDALLLNAAAAPIDAILAAAPDLPALVLTDAAGADAAAAALALPAADFADPAADAGTLEPLLRALLDAGGLRERGLPFQAPAPAPGDAPPLDPAAAPAIRRLIRARRERERLLGAGLFGEPVWDMLLDLAASELEHRRVSVSSLCIAAAVPTTTALRWIKRLCDDGLIERVPDSADRRRHWMVMRPACRAAVARSIALLIA